jgi:hypothetical protein
MILSKMLNLHLEICLQVTELLNSGYQEAGLSLSFCFHSSPADPQNSVQNARVLCEAAAGILLRAPPLLRHDPFSESKDGAPNSTAVTSQQQ